MTPQRAAMMCCVTVMGLSSCGSLENKAVSPEPLPTLDRPVSEVSGATARATTNLWVDDCVRYIELGAFSGSIGLKALFDSAGQSRAELRLICENYNRVDLAGLAGLAAEGGHIEGETSDG